jgi:4-amino-4-deoxy-L-arabinose transferase-like glycosyltransferase
VAVSLIERRDLAVVLLFSALSAGLFLNKAWSIDEPCFLAMARRALADPLRPTDFDYNWHGWAEPMARVNPNPPLVPLLVAPALAAAGGREWLTRLLLLPFDLLAAASLYLLAASFLDAPLLPVLIVLAGPAWWLSMPMVAAEKWVAAFGLAGLALLVRAKKSDARFWLSGALLSLAVLAKLSGAFWVVPALAWARARGASPRRLTGYAAAVLLPAALVVACGAQRLSGLWAHTAGSPYSGLGAAQTARAFLAFVGGCALPACVWPLLGRRTKFSALAAGVVVAAALFSPFFDAERVRLVDRLTGAAFALGALLVLREAARPGADDGGAALWRWWLGAAAALQLFVYWSVVARYVLFLMPPLTFAAAGGLESRLGARARRAVYAASLALSAAVSLALGWVDYSYAGAQKLVAAAVAATPRKPGARLWYTGHWGLQEYMERAGATGLDRSRGGWDQVASGDRVVAPSVNALTIAMPPGLNVGGRAVAVGCVVPLRLISGFDGQAGFYSSASGFLPYALSREPLDRFAFIEKL